MISKPLPVLHAASLLTEENQILAHSAYELTENMPAGTYVLSLTPNDDGKADLAFRFTSKRFLEIFGVKREAILLDPNVVLSAIHPDDLDSMNESNAHAMRTGQPFSWEGRLNVNGITRWYNISSNPRIIPDGVTVWEGVVTDITPRIEAECRLAEMLEVERKLRAEAEKAHKNKSLFISNLSHEIRTPLSALVALSQVMWLRCEALETDPEITQFLNHVRASGQYLNLLFHNVLDNSAAESGRVPVRKTSFYLADWVGEVRNILDLIAVYHHGHLKWKLPENDEARLQTDEMRLTQILLNLVENALKFSKGTGEAVAIEIEKNDGTLRLTVEGHSSGVGTEHLDSVLPEFEQTHDDFLSLATGFGLGLAIVKHNILLLDGSFDVEKKTGNQVRFTVELPNIKGPALGQKP